MASAVHYVHPDKRPQLWINEVGVAPSHQRRGLARAILERLKALGRELGCTEAWVLTDEDNAAARATYASAGGVESHGVVMVTFPFEAGPPSPANRSSWRKPRESQDPGRSGCTGAKVSNRKRVASAPVQTAERAEIR